MVWETKGEIPRDRAVQGGRDRKSYVCLAGVQRRDSKRDTEVSENSYLRQGKLLEEGTEEIAELFRE